MAHVRHRWAMPEAQVLHAPYAWSAWMCRRQCCAPRVRWSSWGSISAAARALGYTQSAVSRQMSALERETGYPLFTRTARGVRLTREGSILIRGATEMLGRLDASAAEMAGATPGRTVRVGVFPAAGAALLPQVVVSLKRSRPEVEIVSRPRRHLACSQRARLPLSVWVSGLMRSQ